MATQLLTGEDTRFLAQQPDYEVDIMVGQMTTLMQNITDLQSDTDDKVAQLENQGWFKRMTNTLFGKNKATKQEIQKNNDKVVTYISQSVAQLYNMNMINERVICSLGNRMNEVYMQVTDMYQEQLNMKGQISQLMAVQKQTMEAMGAFVSKLNEKIESVDNFHMLISEIQNGMYCDSSKLYNLCSILSQLDKRQMDDSRKMSLLRDTMERSRIITQKEYTVLQCLQEIVALPQDKIGLIYLELCNFRNSFPANLFADMIESYHYLSKMEKMSKKKEVIIQRVLDKYELDTDAAFSLMDISESFFENKQACLVSIANVQVSENSNSSELTDNSSSLPELTEEYFDEKFDEFYPDEGEPDRQGWIDFLMPYAEQKNVMAMNEIGSILCYRENAKEAEYGLKMLIEAAESGYDEAQDSLGEYYLINGDFSNSFKWYKKAAEQGHDDSQYELGNCYANGNGVKQNYNEAVKWYRKSASANNSKAQNALGLCYLNGNGVKQSDTDAFFYFKRSAENDIRYPMGERNLGYCYMNGIGTQKNVEQARYWLEKALEDNCDAAQELLDEMDNGSCNEYAPDNIISKANSGDYDAIVDLALAYYWGEDNETYGVEGIEENDAEASKWLEKAAQLGDSYCQFLFGSNCYTGIGVPKNYQRAMKWFKKAAEQGHGKSNFYLFNMYINGFGCKENPELAMQYYHTACDILNDGDDICIYCGSTDYSEKTAGKGTMAASIASSALSGALLGPLGTIASVAASAYTGSKIRTVCTCNDCGESWDKIN